MTHEGAGLLTIYGGVSMAGRIELVQWVDLSMEGERTMQGDGAAHQIAFYSHLGWLHNHPASDLLDKGGWPPTETFRRVSVPNRVGEDWPLLQGERFFAPARPGFWD